MPFKTIAAELFWFMRGETNQKLLEQQGINIWRGNSSREYLDGRGLYRYKEYETLGPIYGFQWRNFGAKYIDCHEKYITGVDQLLNVIDLIKHDPSSRRIIMSAWNPVDLKAMALPPCHILIQFWVSDGKLSAHLYQRSADLMLGVPFNITSYSLLIHIVAKLCNLSAGHFIHSFGDVHIYENHVAGAQQQITRRPKPQPKIQLEFDAFGNANDIIKKLNVDQFKLLNYNFDPRQIKLDMAV